LSFSLALRGAGVVVLSGCGAGVRRCSDREDERVQGTGQAINAIERPIGGVGVVGGGVGHDGASWPPQRCHTASKRAVVIVVH
jgi:hypothetical protein